MHRLKFFEIRSAKRFIVILFLGCSVVFIIEDSKIFRRQSKICFCVLGNVMSNIFICAIGISKMYQPNHSSILMCAFR